MIPRYDMAFAIEPSLSLLDIVFVGELGGFDLFEAEQRPWQDPRRRPGMKILVDTSLVSSINYEVADFQRMIELNQRVLAQGNELEPTAIIVRDEYDITFGNIVDAIASAAVPIKMGVFLTLSEAVEWLGLSVHLAQITEIQRALRLEALALRGVTGHSSPE